MHSTLDIPDHPAWSRLRGYSQPIAGLLKHAYQLRERHPVRAADLVAPLLPLSMALPQRLRVYYLHAKGFAALNMQTAWLETVDYALALANELDDVSALSALFYLRASANYVRYRFRVAAAECHASLELLRQQPVNSQPVAALTAVHILAIEANMRFYLGDYVAASSLLEEARTVLPRGAGQSVEAAEIHWIHALLDRWHGKPELALARAQVAARIFQQHGPSASLVRIQTVVADAALDLAQRQYGGTQRALMLESATAQLDNALDVAQKVGDARGEVLTRLIQTRAGRLRHENVGRVGVIEVLARDGQQLRDDALVANAFTTLGDELVARGEREPGLNCYRQVFGLLDGGDAPALAIWALREYHQTREWQT